MHDANSASPPSSVRFAAGVWFALAAFCVITALLVWGDRDELRDAFASQPTIPRDEVDAAVQAFLVQNTLFQVFFGVVYAVLAWLLRTGRPASRLLLTVVAPLHLLLIVVIGGVSAGALIVLFLAVAGLVLSWLRTSSDYLAGRGQA